MNVYQIIVNVYNKMSKIIYLIKTHKINYKNCCNSSYLYDAMMNIFNIYKIIAS